MEQSMYTPWIEDGRLNVEFYDGLRISYPLPSDSNDGVGVRKTRNMVVTAARKLGARHGQCEWIAKEFRALGYYIVGPHSVPVKRKARRVMLPGPTTTVPGLQPTI